MDKNFVPGALNDLWQRNDIARKKNAAAGLGANALNWR